MLCFFQAAVPEPATPGRTSYFFWQLPTSYRP